MPVPSSAVSGMSSLAAVSITSLMIGGLLDSLSPPL